MPLFQSAPFSVDTGLLVAVLVGIGFGFVLERAGFGSATKLAAQFYGRDMTVFKVMFTAIITAMLGLFWLGWLGIVDLSRISLLPTYLIPQIAGGMIFGVGFVMGGYCPGTCCVAAVTGKVDGWVHLVGMMAGIFLFGELYPLMANFYSSSSLGEISLAQLFGISQGAAVFLVVGLALAGFWFAEQVERRFNPARSS
jgi:uncharacterized membrane protein YedE/YeeE